MRLQSLPPATVVLQSGGSFHFGSDTYANIHTLRAAALACGGTLDVTEAVMSRRVARGVALVRPPGHHAEADGAMVRVPLLVPLLVE